jgi:hypothetical protein
MSYVVVFLCPVSAGERRLFALLILWELLTLLRQCCILCFSFLFKLSFHQFVVKILKREHDFRVIYSINSIITFRTDIQVYTNLGVKLIAFARQTAGNYKRILTSILSEINHIPKSKHWCNSDYVASSNNKRYYLRHILWRVFPQQIITF